MISVSGPERTTAPLVLLAARTDLPGKRAFQVSGNTSVPPLTPPPFTCGLRIRGALQLDQSFILRLARDSPHRGSSFTFAEEDLPSAAGGAEDAAASRRRRRRLHRQERRSTRHVGSPEGRSTLTGHGGDAPSGGPELVPCWSPPRYQARTQARIKGSGGRVFLSAERPERGWGGGFKGRLEIVIDARLCSSSDYVKMVIFKPKL